MILYIHGAGWVFGNAHTHDRLVRELAVGANAAVVFPEYDLSPEVRHPVANEQNYAVAKWVVEQGASKDLDATRIASMASRIDGPVVLVGHSYGGALITVAGTTENVTGLVYVAAHVLEEGESLGELQGRFPLSPLVENLTEWTYPADGADRRSRSPSGLSHSRRSSPPTPPPASPRSWRWPNVRSPPRRSARRPPAAAWKSKPSWALVAGSDQAINPEVERFGAKRARATVVEIEGPSHAVAVCQPKEVADLTGDAVRATS